MRISIVLALVSLSYLLVATSSLSEPVTLSRSEDVVIIPGERDCVAGQLYEHHGNRFAHAGAWQGDGIELPYYGALAEAFDLGRGTIHCGAFWLTEAGNFSGQTADLYVWDGGIGTPPAGVLYMLPGHVFTNVAAWPDIGQSDAPMQVPVSGAFTIGYWGNWPGDQCGYYVGHNYWSQIGHPWTCIAPDLQYPSGWNHPSIVVGWEDVESLGIGVYFGGSSGVGDEIAEAPVPESSTWGAVKALLR